MSFNVGECKMLYTGCNNDSLITHRTVLSLLKLIRKKDLGVIITPDFKSSVHCSEIVKTCNWLGLLIVVSNSKKKR